jgi:dipeptidyl aminopeptidase/acylaminoacyl peptidase
MAAAIRARGGKVEYLLYADEGHGLSKLANRLDAYPKMAAFLEKYLGTEGQSPIRK